MNKVFLISGFIIIVILFLFLFIRPFYLSIINIEIPGPQVNLALYEALNLDDINLCSPKYTLTPGGCYIDFVIIKRNDSYCNQIKGTNNDDATIYYCHKQFEFCKNTTNWCGRK